MPPKPTLTPEEKKALKAEKKAQKKLAAQEKKKQLKRDVISREIKYSNVTLKKYEKEWKEMLVKIALPEMRNDLEFAWHNFERTIDCKDFTISLLMDELRLAERQSVMSYQNHMENIDRLIDIYHERLEEIQDFHNTKVGKVRDQYEEHSENIMSNFEEEQQYLKTIIYMLKVAEKTHKSNMRAEYFSKLEEEETKTSQIIQKMRVILEIIQTDFQKCTQQFLTDYGNQVRERKKQYETLLLRDKSLQALLLTQIEKLRDAYETIKNLKRSLSESKRFLDRKVKDLEDEHHFFFTAFNFLKNRLIEDRQTDSQKLQTLVKQFNEIKEHLEKMLTKGEQILNIGAVCRKLETQEEKITPFPDFGVKQEVKTDEEKFPKEYLEELQLFFQRVGQAAALRYDINEEREFLKIENRILKMKLHKYCQCLTCPSKQRNSSTEIKYITEGSAEYLKYKKQGFNNFKGQMNYVDDDGNVIPDGSQEEEENEENDDN